MRRLKHIGRVCLAAMLLLALLAGCAKTPAKLPTDDTYHPETDHPYMMQTQQTAMYSWFVETDKGYYFRVQTTLFYMDRDSMEPIPVCSKPNCLHYEETDKEKYEACNAFFPTEANYYLGRYGEYLYLETSVTGQRPDGWLTTVPAIVRVTLDGSRRETVRTLGDAGSSSCRP